MKLDQVGEFGLIDRIRKLVDVPSEGIVLGIGDDAAVFRTVPGHLAVMTTDALAEGVHFDLSYTPLESLGWKALAISISDIAAMGGIPKYAVVSMAIPENWSVEDVESFYKGMARCGHTYDCTIIGGDTVGSKSGCFISVTVVGEVEKDSVVQRNGASAGDMLCVTGSLGESRTGREVLKSKTDVQEFPRSVKRFLEPRPRIREARELIRETGDVTAMIDISDGLASEIHHLCRESGVGCIIREENIPISDEAVQWTKHKELSPVQFVLQSGEEYELLFTVKKSKFETWQKNPPKEINIIPLGGIVKRKKDIYLVRNGKRFPITLHGWDHFGA
ncbi:thiamine-phosphate kinase [bacterium]